MAGRHALAFALALVCAPAAAIVNIESARRGADQQGLVGRLDLSLNGASGNTDNFYLTLGHRLQWNHGRATELGIFEYAYGESNDVSDTNNLFLHYRHTEQITERRAVEAFAQAEENEFTRLSFRGLLGAGVRYTLADADATGAHLGLGAFFVRENLEERVGLTDGGTDDFWRANLYLSLTRRLDDHIRAVNVVYYQPALEDAGDYRLLDEAALKVKFSDRVDLRISLEVTHDSRPPQAVEETDVSYVTGVEYSF